MEAARLITRIFKMGRKSVFFFLPVLLFLGAASYLYAAGTTAADFLKISPSARSSGLGEAFTAVADDASSVYWNTAGLAALKYRELLLTHNVWFQSIRHSNVIAAIPIRNELSNPQAIGISAAYLDAGSMERRVDGTPGAQGSFKASDMAVSVAYSRTLTRPLNRPFSLGASVKFIRQEIDTYSAQAVACDLGFLFNFGVGPQNIVFGAAVQNAGTKIKFVEESYSLPLTYTAGISIIPKIKDRSLPLQLALDVSMPKDEKAVLKAGAEFSTKNTLFIRAGYINQGKETRAALLGGAFGMGDDSKAVKIAGLMAGFGVKIPLSAKGFSADGLNIDYAFVPYGELGNTHRMSLGIKY